MSTQPQTNKRLLALDILRGITIAGMILVNNPGSWGHIYAPLRHAAWNGLTPTDLVFPFFMFIMGISTYISLRKYNFEFSKSALWKIVKRTVLIFVIGMAIGWFSRFCYYWASPTEGIGFGAQLWEAFWNFDRMRIMGVMQRLALCYGVTAILALTLKHRYLPWIILVLLVGYFVILMGGNGFAYNETNIVSVVDRAILTPVHMYKDNGIDPEGLLSTIPSIAHVLIGLMCGEMIMKTKDNNQRTNDLFRIGVILTFAGLLLNYGLPINKSVWSPTYVLTTCGLGASLLGLLIWIIDIKGRKTWCRFFESFGINPLFLYVLGGVLGILFGAISIGGVSIKGWIHTHFLLAMVGDAFLASCLYAIVFVIINWCIGYILYKKKIYIKI